MKKGKEVPYSLGDNFHFIYANMWAYDKSLIFYGFAEIIFNVILPLCTVILPSVVVGLLERQAGIEKFIQTMVLVFLVYSIVSAVQTFLTSRNRNQYIDIRLNFFSIILFEKCFSMDYGQLEKEKTREELKKSGDSVYGNWQGLEGFMHRNVSLLTNVLGLLTYALVVGWINPVFLLLLLVLSVIQILVFHRAKLYEHKQKNEMSGIRVTQGYLQEQAFDLKAGKDIRLYQLDKLIGRVYAAANNRLKKIKGKIRGVYYVNDIVEILLKFLRDGLCYGYLIYLLMHGLPVSDFVLYLGIVGGLAGWMMKITEDLSEIGRCHYMICDFRKFCDIKDTFSHKSGRELEEEDMALDIVFDHVSYQYEGSSDYVLKDISFHMGKGDKFALVGVNGAGKTTLVKLMCGFYQPTGGRILINGIDIGELNIENYFKQIAVVFQDAAVLSFTIGENISGVPGSKINREELDHAIELSGLKEKIDGLPKGTGTYLNKDMEESGIQLSGGELQKLLLARALYKKAKLLLFDEPTAAMDAIAESELYEQYQDLLRGRTALFISHRLASTRYCDNILFLENGKIAETGSHESLMKLNGRYAEMFQVQSKYYKEEEDETEESMA
ncbi:ATP-binding cassette, subfamily B [Anaerocolumna jejuensis DSM 15929]|uniref:ATP-binding cassette, subfamily B n=1 Tax=Anaerocolumna jejuensis DSM 15929 TaxID=1121322 RepID=A0A1M6UZD5_9FIRM|nr:ABC transporter ATP-binding protein [Anaerocolumna jejuensis]SHK74619.1 ATP-binding cassette, subfamily B [Anaerocolumna jejuensis DSM 15929]